VRFAFERKLWQQGYKLVAGIDEVGRGPLAGPIVAAAVVFPPNIKLRGLEDSKKVSAAKREALALKIKQRALAIGISQVSHKKIDELRIGKADLLAMKQAVVGLQFLPDYLLIDGRRNQLDLEIEQLCLIDGDARCASVAAASIVAKVFRDKIMLEYHKKYPDYLFHQHKGYGTRAHIKKIKQYGPCPIHRRSFFPVSQFAQT